MSVVRWSDPFTKIIQAIRSPSIYALRESFWQRDSVKRTKKIVRLDDVNGYVGFAKNNLSHSALIGNEDDAEEPRHYVPWNHAFELCLRVGKDGKKLLGGT
ncbi:unnamed protein product [Fusarium graminearum]|nr:unnamed protein product [Fusarium graminearum]